MQILITEAIQQLSQNIRKVREFRNYSQDYVGALLGLTQNGYSKIELNQSKITVERLYEIAVALDVQIYDLLDLDLAKINKLNAKKIDVILEKQPQKGYMINYFRTSS